jgi:hypothetical protein
MPYFPAMPGDQQHPALPERAMVTLRVVRHDREQVLAVCRTLAVPARGEVLQLDTVDAQGERVRPTTMWRVVSVTLSVPSLNSEAPADGSPLCVREVEVAVLPDVSLVPTEFAQAAESILSESRM